MRLVHLLLATSLCLALQAKEQDSKGSAASASCRIEFKQPTNGDGAGVRATVIGTAEVSRGHLWLLAHKRALGNSWWPQQEAVIENGRFELEVALGIPSDRGPFEVVAIFVDESTNQRLLQWLSTAPDKNYPPIQFPAALDGCVPAKLTLMRQ
jgi:hypothetical protein